VGDKYLYLIYYVHLLVGIKEVIDYKNARSVKPQIDDTETQSDGQTDARQNLHYSSTHQKKGVQMVFEH